MRSLAQAAARELFLVNLGVRSTAEVVRWADSLIAEEGQPDPRLIELSTTCPERIDHFISALSDMRTGSDFWSGVREAMPALHDYVEANPEEAERIASSLYMLAAGDVDAMPTDFSFIFRFDDAFYLARDGTYGTVADVQSEFLAELKKFKGEPNKTVENNSVYAPRNPGGPLSS